MTKEKVARKCLGFVEVKLKGEVYSRRYAMKNIEMVVNLINEMFYDEIKVTIVSAEEIKTEE